MRQIIGWREYVWGMYWLRREPGATRCAPGAPLPAAYWGEPTGWNCLDTVVAAWREDATPTTSSA